MDIGIREARPGDERRAAHTGSYLDRDDARWAASLIDNPDDIRCGVGERDYLRGVDAPGTARFSSADYF